MIALSLTVVLLLAVALVVSVAVAFTVRQDDSQDRYIEPPASPSGEAGAAAVP